MKRPTSSRAELRGRQERSDKAAGDLEPVLAETVERLAFKAEQAYRREALKAVRAQFADTDKPGPTVPLRNLWDNRLWAAAMDGIEQFFTLFVIDELEAGFGLQVTSTQPFVTGIAARHVAAIEDWGNDFRSTIAATIDRGHQELLSIRDIATAIQDAGETSAKRAVTIARTETIAVSNGASMTGALAAAEPGDMKEWIATNDSRTRDDHEDADGQQVPIEGLFRVGTEQAEYPGHGSLSPGLRINCRCTYRWIPV